MTIIRLGLLGGFVLTGEDGEPINIAMRKAKALLTWLALRPGEPQTRERLAGLLWAESGEAAARHSLRQALSVLRRALPRPDRLLQADGDRIVLLAESLDIDVSHFCVLAKSADPADLEQAMALYRGEFLEGFGTRAPEFEDWMLAERTRLRGLACDLMTQLLELSMTRQEWESALRCALGLLSLEPLRESVQREAMSLEVRLGRPAEALRRYRSLEVLLQRDLGVAPETATRELYRRILAERRIGTNADPEQNRQGPAAATATQVTRNPAPPPLSDTGLLGREAELHQCSGVLDGCLASGTGAVLLIRGEAGIGKTALANAAASIATARGCHVHRVVVFEPGTDAPSASAAMVARELLGLPEDADAMALRQAIDTACDDPRDALFLCDVLGLELDPAEAPFLFALDHPERQAGLIRAIGALLIRAASLGPRLLLVEDIHWAEAGFAELLAGLAAVTAGIPALLLLTSRHGGEPLDPAWRAAMGGVPLATLDPGPLRPAAAQALAKLLTSQDTDWIRRCVERAAGNPLFLEHLIHAGAELGTAVPASVRQLIEHRLTRLSPRDRHTVQAASVLGQRFSAEALHVLLDDQSDPCLDLCGAGLLRREGDWYQFTHALVRDSIHASVSAPARRTFHRKAADWYRSRDTILYSDHLTQAGDPGASPAYLEAARECVESHRQDLALRLARHAFELAHDTGQRARAGLFLAGLQREFGEITAARRLLKNLIAESTDEQILCDARIELADALLVQDAYDESLTQLQAAEPVAMALMEEHGGEARLARLFEQRGNACFSLGRIEACMTAHGRALEHARAAGDPELEAHALGGLADAYYQRGRMVTAHHYYDRCVRLCQAHELFRVQAPNLAGRAICAIYLNRVHDALNDAGAALRLSSLTHRRRDECLARNVLAIAAYQGGDLEHARRESEEGLTIARDIGMRRFEADHLSMRGATRAALGRVDEGLADLEAAWSLVKDRDMAYGGPWVLGFFAQYCADPKRRHELLSLGEAALAKNSLSHNHFQFRQCALEIALNECDTAALAHHAEALHRYTEAEPLPWSDLQIARARVLSDWCEGERAPASVRRLRALESEARSAGLAALADSLAALLESQHEPRC